MPRVYRALLAAIFLAAVLSACTATRMPPGPGATEPRLNGDSFVTADGLALPLRSWLPETAPSAVILALHGFNDYSRAFERPAAWLADQGIATYAYDQRGFGAAPHTGLWAGTETLVGDLRVASGLLRARHPGVPLFLLGDSMGGAVVLVAMAGATPIAAEGAILSAPAVWARSELPFYVRAALWILSNTVPWATVTGEGVEVQASDNIELLRELGRDPLFIKETRIGTIDGLTDLMSEAYDSGPRLKGAALLLYGEKDEIVPREPSLKLWKSLPDGPDHRQRPALYEEGWHMLLRDLQAEVVFADIAAWIADRAAPLPSGADRRALAALNGAAPDTLVSEGR